MLEAEVLIIFVALAIMMLLWAFTTSWSWCQTRRLRRAFRDLKLAYKENSLLKQQIGEMESLRKNESRG